MTTDLDARGAEHLLRADGQEDVCLALYRPSTGSRRTTALLADLVLPLPGERTVHGTASFQGSYVVRAASLAAANDLGVALLHSHPGGIGWQGMSGVDRDTERSYAHVAEIITGQPLVGMTLAGDRTWSARTWDPDRGHRDAESVRVVGPGFRVHWNNVVRPAPVVTKLLLTPLDVGAGNKASIAVACGEILVFGIRLPAKAVRPVPVD